MRYRKGVDPDMRGGGKALKELEGEEDIIKVYFVRKKSIFNKKKIIKNKMSPKMFG